MQKAIPNIISDIFLFAGVQEDYLNPYAAGG